MPDHRSSNNALLSNICTRIILPLWRELTDTQGSEASVSEAKGLLTWRWGTQIGAVTCGGSPHLSCKRDQIKMRDYMDGRVTPPKRVALPSWGPHFYVNRPQVWNHWYENDFVFIITRKVLHLASALKWGFLELGNNLSGFLSQLASFFSCASRSKDDNGEDAQEKKHPWLRILLLC